MMSSFKLVLVVLIALIVSLAFAFINQGLQVKKSKPEFCSLATCWVCIREDGSRVYKNFTIQHVEVPEVSEEELSIVRGNILRANPEFTDCLIISCIKLRED